MNCHTTLLLSSRILPTSSLQTSWLTKQKNNTFQNGRSFSATTCGLLFTFMIEHHTPETHSCDNQVLHHPLTFQFQNPLVQRLGGWRENTTCATTILQQQKMVHHNKHTCSCVRKSILFMLKDSSHQAPRLCCHWSCPIFGLLSKRPGREIIKRASLLDFTLKSDH